jgi:penicillin-binding protein 1A
MKWLMKPIKFFLWLGLLGSLTGAIAVASLYYYLEPEKRPIPGPAAGLLE